jgi:predicted Zn-dependent protease
MSDFFYNLGKSMGPQVRKGKWLWQSLTGNEADVIQAEYQVGQDLAREIRQQTGHTLEPEIEFLLQEIGSRLAARVANKKRKFKFDAIKGTEPNAFALPGGFIFLTESLVNLCVRKTDEMAFVLGHEMAHVIRGHAMERIISSTAIAAVSLTAPTRHLLTAWLRKVGLRFFEGAYSQERELEADTLGTRLIVAAGYDPCGPIQLLSRLAEQSQTTRKFNLGSYFSSHPPFAVRIQNLKQQLRR